MSKYVPDRWCLSAVRACGKAPHTADSSRRLSKKLTRSYRGIRMMQQALLIPREVRLKDIWMKSYGDHTHSCIDKVRAELGITTIPKHVFA